MSERLEEIKDDLPLTIREYPDVEKLIEYVEELEEDKGNLSNLNTEIAKYSWNLVQEINRYKQALEEIKNTLDKTPYREYTTNKIRHKLFDIANKSLKGESQ
ncbi:hypothetical protein CHI07_17010 [Paenibacillus sp. 7884-2]|nr:hypothetical protein CHI07_17010 [Paenibacillus sp. 7884-2]